MRIAIFGTGGLGGYFGARWAQAGEDVAFIARGAHLQALRDRGLTVRSPGLGDIVLPHVRATADPADIGPVDVVIIGVKLWDTNEAARAAAPLLGAETAIVSFQNGVDKDDTIAAEAGRARVFGGVSYISASIAAPGTIAHAGTMARLVVGELDGRASARIGAFAAACARAGIDCVVAPDIRRATWEKFVFLTGLSGVTSLLRAPVGTVRDDPGGRRLLTEAMRETAAVAAAAGVALAAGFVESRVAFIDGLPAAFDSSMHTDLERGNRLELPWLAGAVVRIGALHGIATPVNAFITDALGLYAGGRVAQPA